MKRALLATGAALILTAASFVASADARGRGGASGGGSFHGASGGGVARGANIGGGGGRSIRMGSSGARVFSSGAARTFGSVSTYNGAARGITRGGRVGGVHHARHFRRGSVFVGGPYLYGAAGYDDECLVPQRVLTNLGWRVVLVNVCDDDY